MTYFVTDTFGSPHGTLITAHADSNGNAWSLNTGSTGPTNDIQSSEVRPYGQPNFLRCGTAAPQADYTVGCNVRKDGSPGFVTIAGPMARVASGANTFYAAIVDTNVNQIRLVRYNAGTAYTLATYSFAAVYQTTYFVELVVAGSSSPVSLTVKLDSSTVISYSDDGSAGGSVITAAGYPGLFTYTAADTVGFFINYMRGDYTPSGGGGSSPTPTPTLTSANPTFGIQNSTQPVALVGTNLTGATTVTPSGTGVSASAPTVTDDTHASVNLTIGPTATTGARTLTITTPAGTSNTVSFTVRDRSLTSGGSGSCLGSGSPFGRASLEY